MSTLLITHILVALSAIVESCVLYYKPSTKKFVFSIILSLATIITGIGLVVTTNTSIVSACISGLIFTGAITYLNVLAYRKYKLT
jgi:hypothetical protein